MKHVLFKLVLFYLLLMSLTVNNLTAVPKSLDDKSSLETSSVTIDQDEGLSRPIFVEMSNGELLRERNDTAGNGAIYRGNVYQNVTITYAVLNGDNTTDLSLYADLPNQLSLSRETANKSLAFTYDHIEFAINYTLPYLEDADVIANATLAYYTVELNVTASFIPFYAAITAGQSEDDNAAPHNLITDLQTWETNSFDEFYVQNENVTISLFAQNATNIDVYGIEWKITSDLNFVDFNFTFTFTSSNVTAEINLEDQDPNTIIEWKSYAILNDTVLNMTRDIRSLEHKFIEIADGTPTLSTLVESNFDDELFYRNTLYTQNNDLVFNFSASVQKGNVTGFTLVIKEDELVVLNQTVNPTLNASTIGDTMNSTFTLPNEGFFEVIISAETNKDLMVNSTFFVMYDITAPFVNLQLPLEGATITSFEGQVLFEFTFSDTLSNVRFAILDLGDGTQIDVTKMANYTHIYIDKSRSYTITLTIIDWAGNINSDSVIITLDTPGFDKTSAPTTELWVFLLIVVLIITSPLYFSKLRELVKR